MWFHSAIAIELDFHVVDAGAWAYYIEDRQQPLFSVQRIAHTTGSVHYVLSASNQPEIAAIRLRAIGPSLTIVRLFLAHRIRLAPPETVQRLADAFMAIVWAFSTWITNDVERFTRDAANLKQFVRQVLSPEQIIERIEQAPRQVGRPQTEENKWAQAQFEDGRSINDILTDYTLLLGLDATNIDDRRRARERLRKVREGINRKK
jgi:hypothetical protein